MHANAALIDSFSGDMWRMLCTRAQDLEVEWKDVDADDNDGRAHWEARYTFTLTGRRAHNIIEARFHFTDGKIRAHCATRCSARRPRASTRSGQRPRDD